MHLGLSQAEFYRLTPRQYHLLMERHLERTEHTELLFGIVASSIANYAGKILKKGTTVKPSDVMPALLAKKRREERSKPLDLINADIRRFLMVQLKAQGGSLPGGEGE